MLVADVFRDKSTIHTLRLIPEMTFACNGTIVGLTVAGRRRAERSINPIVQIWRQNSSQNIYYNTRSGIAINESECLDNFIVLQGSMEADITNGQVWYCNLSATNQVPVEAGDILGLLLPPIKQSSFQLSFASVSKGPINYVFENPQEMPFSYPAENFSNAISENYQLPQISVQVKSGTIS